MTRFLLASLLFAALHASTATAQDSDPWQAAGLTDSDRSSLRQAYEAGRYAIRESHHGYQAFNLGQRWMTVFDGSGFEVSPSNHEWTWGLGLISYGWGTEDRVVEQPQAITTEGGRIAYEWDAVLTEWFVNDTRGLEHGYTLSERPEMAEALNSSGSLRLKLQIRGGLEAVISADGRNVGFSGPGEVPVLNYSGLTVFDADGQALRAGFSHIPDGLCLEVEDAAARYPLTIDPVAQQAYVKASNTGPNDNFGGRLSISGDTVVVGAPREGSGATGVNGDEGDTSDGFQSGAAYVFVRDGGSWTQQAYLKALNTGEMDRFGSSVAISGDTIVIGAAFEDSNAAGVNGDDSSDSLDGSGAAYVFVRSGGLWSQQAYLKASNPDGTDHFGISVSISGDTIVVGATREGSSSTGVDGNQSDNGTSNAGAAYVFVRAGTVWQQQAYLKASNTNPQDSFGGSVSISGNTVIVGASEEASGATGINGNQVDNSTPSSGAAYVFVRTNGIWSQQAYLKASNTASGAGFGFAISVDGDSAVITARGEGSDSVGVDGDENNNGAPGSGAAYVFQRSGGIWSQQAYLKASNTEAGDAFGDSASISGSMIVVGADSEDSDATGVNGDQSNNDGFNSGAAYVFVRDGTAWSQIAYLKASNTGVQDRFGRPVSISGTTVVVGAPDEDSDAMGVGGDDANNSAPASGAMYVFEVPQTVDPVIQSAYVKASNTGEGDRFGLSLAIYGDTVVIGAPREASAATVINGNQLDDSAPLAGAAYVFVRDANGWTQQAYLKAQNTDSLDGFGVSVALSADTLVVGAPREDSAATGVDGNQADNAAPESGAAYVFVRTSGVWSQQAYLKASNTDAGDGFGESVAISGDTIVIGAIGEDSNATGVDGNQADNSASTAGASYVFHRNAATWSQQAYLKASNSEPFDRFGTASISGNTIVVGATGEASGSAGVDGNQADNGTISAGAAYVFVRTGNEWAQQAYLKASNPGTIDLFGFVVSVVGDTLAVAAFGEDSNATGVNGNQFDNSALTSGAVYVFVRTGSSWNQQAYVKASNPDAQDVFGYSMALFSDTLVVGALGEDSSATNVNGDSRDNSAETAGAAYVFRRMGSDWSQQAYLKASNAEAEDAFGLGVSVFGDTVLIGANGESSAANGIGGDQADNNSPGSGAAYFFDLSGLDAIGTSLCEPALANSTGMPGTLSAEGSILAVDNDVTLVAANLPLQQAGFLLNARQTTTIAISDGILCIGPDLGRHNAQIGNSGMSGMISTTLDLTSLPRPIGGSVAVAGGETWYFQFWYRDGSGSSNLTHAVEILCQ